MSGWKEYSFGDLVDFPPKIQLKKGEEYPFIDMDIVKPENRYVTNLQSKKYDSSGSAKFADKDVLLARITPCLENGKISQVKISEGTKGFGSTEFFVFRAKVKLLDQNFLFYLSKSDLIWKNAVNSMVGASGRQRADASFLKRVTLIIPELDEQRKIAAIVTSYDDLIENNQRRIALLEKMAEELYREWFVRLRFPGHEKVKVVKGMPEGWESKPLTLLADITYGYAFDGARFNAQGNGKPIIRIRNIINSNITEFTDEIPNDKYIVKCGDLLVGMDGEFHVNHWINDEGYLVQRVCRINAKSERIRGYLAQAIKAPIKHFESILQGATVGHLGAAHLKTINLLNPPESMNKHLEILNSLLDQKITISRMNLDLSKTRDLLLPRLISGRLPVEHLDIKFPPSMLAEMQD